MSEHTLDGITRGGETFNQQDVTSSLAELAEKVTSLEIRRRELDAELKAVSRELDTLDVEMIGLMDSHGVEMMRCSGITIYTRKVRYLSVSDPTEMSHALQNSAEWRYLVKENYNGNSLRSAVLEVLDSGGELPPEIGGLVEVHEIRKLSFRK